MFVDSFLVQPIKKSRHFPLCVPGFCARCRVTDNDKKETPATVVENTAASHPKSDDPNQKHVDSSVVAVNPSVSGDIPCESHSDLKVDDSSSVVTNPAFFDV